MYFLTFMKEFKHSGRGKSQSLGCSRTWRKQRQLPLSMWPVCLTENFCKNKAESLGQDAHSSLNSQGDLAQPASSSTFTTWPELVLFWHDLLLPPLLLAQCWEDGFDYMPWPSGSRSRGKKQESLWNSGKQETWNVVASLCLAFLGLFI